MKRTALSFFALAAVACGGGEPATEDAATGAPAAPAQEAAAPAGEMTMPDWYSMDGNNVTLEMVAGQTDQGNYWNFNGHQNGTMTITVPQGAEVTINFSNNDPNMAHSIGVNPDFDSPPAAMNPDNVAFPGAISTNPTSMSESTLPGESETITFTASEAGDYTIVCYVPAHAISGMWVRFVVSAEGEAGVTME